VSGKLARPTGIKVKVSWKDGRATEHELIYYESNYLAIKDEEGVDWWFKRDTGLLCVPARERGSRVSVTRISNLQEITTALLKRRWDANAKKKWGWQGDEELKTSVRRPGRKRNIVETT